MTMPAQNPNRRPNVLGRVALTIAVGAAVSGIILLMSGTAKAIEYIDRTDNALAELWQYISDGHASIRERVATHGSSVADGLVRFQTAVDRRIARLRNLNTLIEQQTGVGFWTRPLHGSVGVQHIQEEGREYVSAAAKTPTMPVTDLAMSQRLFDLHALKLIQTVSAVRDRAATARARAMVAAEGMVALLSCVGGLLIAYLIWRPVVRGAYDPIRGTPLPRLTA